MIRKIWARYQKLQQPVKASLWFLICGFAQKGIAMLTLPIFSRIMTEAEYGRFNVYNSWFSIVEIIVALDLAGSAFTRGLVKHEEDQARYTSSLLGLATTCTLAWSVIYLVFHRAITDILGLSQFLALAMLVEVWTHIAYQFWANKERVNYRYKKLVAITLAYVILRPALGVCFVLLADTAKQVEGRVLALVLVNVALYASLAVSVMRKGRQYYNKQYWLYALKLTIPLLPHCLAHIVLSQTDRLMINAICGPEETAYYSMAYTLATVLQILNSAVFSSMNPWLYKQIKQQGYGKIGKMAYGILALIALANLALVIMAPELMLIIAPPSYSAALAVIPPVTGSIFFMALHNLFVVFEYYYEKTYYVTIGTVAAAALNVLLNALLIPRFGFVAAGYTTLACYMLCALGHYAFMRKINKTCMGGAMVYQPKVLLALSGALLAVSAVAMLLYETVLLRYLLFAGLAAVVALNRKSLLQAVKGLKKSK